MSTAQEDTTPPVAPAKEATAPAGDLTAQLIQASNASRAASAENVKLTAELTALRGKVSASETAARKTALVAGVRAAFPDQTDEIVQALVGGSMSSLGDDPSKHVDELVGKFEGMGWAKGSAPAVPADARIAALERVAGKAGTTGSAAEPAPARKGGLTSDHSPYKNFAPDTGQL